MSEDENMAVVRSAYDDGINHGDVARHMEAFAPGYINHYAGRDLDPEAFEKIFDEFYEGFPDLNTTIEEMFASGDWVAVRHTYRGTHTGTYLGFPPSGAKVEVAAHDLYRMADGKIAEEWVVMDQLGMLQQMGIIPRRDDLPGGADASS